MHEILPGIRSSAPLSGLGRGFFPPVITFFLTLPMMAIYTRVRPEDVLPGKGFLSLWKD